MRYLFFITIGAICFLQCKGQEQKVPKTTQSSIYTFSKGTPDGIGKYYFGREIAHVMGPGGIDWLNRAERNKEENTTLAIDKMSLSPDAVVADIGAGSGYYSFKMAAKAPKGKVYAVEVQEEMIAYLIKEKTSLKDSVVEVIKGDAKSPHLPDHSVDLAIMVDVYHELEYPQEMLQSIKKTLKKNGKLLLIEYRGEDPQIAIKEIHKTTVVQLNKEMAANGFTLYHKGNFLPIQHFLLYEVKDSVK